MAKFQFAIFVLLLTIQLVYSKKSPMVFEFKYVGFCDLTGFRSVEDLQACRRAELDVFENELACKCGRGYRWMFSKLSSDYVSIVNDSEVTGVVYKHRIQTFLTDYRQNGTVDAYSLSKTAMQENDHITEIKQLVDLITNNQEIPPEVLTTVFKFVNFAVGYLNSDLDKLTGVACSYDKAVNVLKFQLIAEFNETVFESFFNWLIQMLSDHYLSIIISAVGLSVLVWLVLKVNRINQLLSFQELNIINLKQMSEFEVTKRQNGVKNDSTV